ncbi:outer membrane lipoprotein carrier protein LolA [Oceanimonas doudoroffii]|uniref:Outer membrane lipoprotein carrier protein LolA n=1 Tax=Oceanimonas doudoroffii TaxID=84158 RepID=A0A233RCB5_9GAMM|nr:outer membrane lipoprotein carrier protein LolA [Oceanimonas doudoroffii]OXY81033.1 hypothetical protein B6S08_15040 [Oceanimonas doudoroffii]
MKKVLLLLAALWWQLPVQAAASDYQALAALMQSPQSLNGGFEQVRYLAALDTDIRSEGRFSYEAGSHIRWHTLSPIENLLTLTPERITSEQNGTLLSRLETRSNPVVALFSDIFFGVMTARWDSLSQHFEVQSRITGPRWQATLLPREASLARLVIRIELKGDGYLREARLFEAGGDSTRIRFLDLPQ